ncbi:MAG: LysM peptidoglycan-binding domain-containing protein, partial [Gammaproteobacteria bacterium]|nr:LysM peptidoglycan-binding domain-containing protein [Gammaproteobacteria bacterium]
YSSAPLSRICVTVIALCLLPASILAKESTVLPRPPELEPAIQFWTRVYTEVSSQGGLVHDDRELNVVYDVVHFPPETSRRARAKRVKEVKQYYRNMLLTLSQGKRQDLSPDARRVLAQWPEDVTNRTLRAAADRVRFQLGQADKFRAGLIRSGAWEKHIQETFSKMGLPMELAALPHVESSYNPVARSHVGAVGLWQFTRSTGRRYMRVDHIVDERWDPFQSTIAAAQLLEHNYNVIGSWPLAITAYNHGSAGMRLAVEKLGTDDIVTIIRNYNGRTFGFASRNFYVAFLAALDVANNSQKYFGKLYRDTPADTVIVEVPDYMNIATIKRALGVDGEILMENNPALRPPVWRGSKYVPRGYELRLPRNIAHDSAETVLASTAPSERYSTQKRDQFYTVERGDTLSLIAARFNTSAQELTELNGLRSKHFIVAGQTIRLPYPEGAASTTLAAAGPPEVEPIELPADGLYSVRRGDTLASLARRFAVREEDLVAVNGLSNRHLIHPGQTLRLGSVAAGSDEASAGEPLASTKVDDTETTLASATNEVGVLEVTETATSGNEITEAPPAQQTAELQLALSAESDNALMGSEETAGAKPAQPLSDKAPSELASTPVTSVPLSEVQLQELGLPGAGEVPLLVAVGNPPPSGNESLGVKAPLLLDALSNPDRAKPDSHEPPSIEQADPLLANLPAEAGESPVGDDDTTEIAGGEMSDAEIVAVESAEPASAEEAESLGPTLPAAVHPALSADPSNYSVASDNTIEVEAAETLGHYAEWLQIRASRLRQINKLNYGQPVVTGDRLQLDFSRVSPEQFEQQRLAYHSALQDTFFGQFQITGANEHVVQWGDSLWLLARRTYDVPVWLLRQYNPDLDLDAVRPGTRVIFPRVERRQQGTPEPSSSL